MSNTLPLTGKQQAAAVWTAKFGFSAPNLRNLNERSISVNAEL
jgi:hypothetical protein